MLECDIVNAAKYTDWGKISKAWCDGLYFLKTESIMH